MVRRIGFIGLLFFVSIQAMVPRAGVKRQGADLERPTTRQRVGATRNRERYFGNPNRKRTLCVDGIPVCRERVTLRSGSLLFSLPKEIALKAPLLQGINEMAPIAMNEPIDILENFDARSLGHFEALMKDCFYDRSSDSDEADAEDEESYYLKSFALAPKAIGGVLKVAHYFNVAPLIAEIAKKYRRELAAGCCSFKKAREELFDDVRFKHETGPFSLQELIDQGLIPEDVAGVKEIRISYPIDSFDGLSRLHNRESLKRIVMTQDIVELDGSNEQEKLTFDRMSHTAWARVRVAKGVHLVR